MLLASRQDVPSVDPPISEVWYETHESKQLLSMLADKPQIYSNCELAHVVTVEVILIILYFVEDLYRKRRGRRISKASQ